MKPAKLDDTPLGAKLTTILEAHHLFDPRGSFCSAFPDSIRRDSAI
jgi:hypothetical protein